MSRDSMDLDTMIENIESMVGHFGVIDYVKGPDHTFVLRWLHGSKRLIIDDVYPDDPEGEHGDTFTVDYADTPEGISALLDKWWNARGRMTFAANNPGHPEDPYGRPDLIYFHQRLKGGETV